MVFHVRFSSQVFKSHSSCSDKDRIRKIVLRKNPSRMNMMKTHTNAFSYMLCTVMHINKAKYIVQDGFISELFSTWGEQARKCDYRYIFCVYFALFWNTIDILIDLCHCSSGGWHSSARGSWDDGDGVRISRTYRRCRPRPYRGR